MKNDINEKLENLTNYGQIDMMHHQWMRYQSVNSIFSNKFMLWRRWMASTSDLGR